MKKFVFQLDALYSIKKTLKDKLQAEYAEAEAILESAVLKKDRMEKTIEEESEKFKAKARSGIAVYEIQTNEAFLEDLLKQHKAAVADTERARRNAERKRNELLGVFQETKALEKLRDRQYKEFLVQAEKHEMNVVEDILSYNISKENVNRKAM